jgi:tetratricopeptide (TPR) repeat protein
MVRRFDIRAVPRGLLAVLVLAALVRTAYWMEVRDLPLLGAPTGDAATHVALAETMGRDGPLAPRGEAYTQAPLYPLYLWMMGLSGASLETARLVQFALGVITAGLLWGLGRRLGGPAAGTVAGLLAAAYGPLVFFGGELLSITLAVFLLALGLNCLAAGRPLAAGVGLGVAALAQPHLLLAAGAAAGWGWWRPEDLALPGRRAALVLAAGLLLPPALCGVRNLAEAGAPVLISSNGGVNFFIGNHEWSNGTFHIPPGSGLLNRPEGLFASAREVAEAARGRSLGVTGVDRYWWGRGLEFWTEAPARAASLAARKVLLVFNDYEVPNHFDYGYFRRASATLRALPTLGWILPLAGVGLFAAWRRGQRTPVVWLAALTLSVALFFVTARYRLPVVAVLLPAAGTGVAALWRSRRHASRLALLAGVGIAYAGLAFLPLAGGEEATAAHMHNLEGATLYQQGDVDGAAAAFERALHVQPNHAEALNNLGKMRLLQDRREEARALFDRALAANPGQAETYFNLEELLRDEGDPRGALALLDRLETTRGGRIDDVAAALGHRRGMGALALGDTAAALLHFRAAVSARPSLAGPWISLAELLAASADWDRALDAARRGAELAPRHRGAQLVLGRALRETGRSEEALTALRRAWALDPDRPEAPYEIGVLHESAGDLAGAEGHYYRSARETNHPPALLALGRLYERTGRVREAATAYRLLLRHGGEPREEAAARARLADLDREAAGGR